MKLYVGFYNKRFKRVIGKLSKNGKYLEDVVVVIPIPTQDGFFIPVLQHLDNSWFAYNSKNERIKIDVKVKELDDFHCIDYYNINNAQLLTKLYIDFVSINQISIPNNFEEDNENYIEED